MHWIINFYPYHFLFSYIYPNIQKYGLHWNQRKVRFMWYDWEWWFRQIFNEIFNCHHPHSVTVDISKITFFIQFQKKILLTIRHSIEWSTYASNDIHHELLGIASRFQIFATQLKCEQMLINISILKLSTSEYFLLKKNYFLVTWLRWQIVNIQSHMQENWEFITTHTHTLTINI